MPGQDGLNLNPQWAPDGHSVAYVSDRNGTANVFLYDFDTREHFQLTNVVGAVSRVDRIQSGDHAGRARPTGWHSRTMKTASTRSGR